MSKKMTKAQYAIVAGLTSGTTAQFILYSRYGFQGHNHICGQSKYEDDIHEALEECLAVYRERREFRVQRSRDEFGVWEVLKDGKLYRRLWIERGAK